MNPRAALVAVLVGAAPAAGAETAQNNYLLHCSGCHGLDGLGSKVGRVPPFPGFLGPISRANGGRDYLVLVPGVANADLSDAETAAVLNQVLRDWGNEPARLFTAEEVGAIRARKIDDIAAARAQIAAELRAQGVSIDY